MLDRRKFLGTLIGGVAGAAAVRTWPFRVYSFPRDLGAHLTGVFPSLYGDGGLPYDGIQLLRMTAIPEELFEVQERINAHINLVTSTITLAL